MVTAFIMFSWFHIGFFVGYAFHGHKEPTEQSVQK